MTHPNHQTNGASLEDCHTNFFALTELYGIKWRKLVWGESQAADGGEEGGAALADPVISSYARCLAGDILCVWRRVAAPAPPVDLYDIAPAPPQPPPPLSLRAAKELWIFWYGEEPDLSGMVAPELIAGQGEQGSWESGLSYECRSLLFKALHNLIERCLLSRDFVRLGKWFVQPYDGDEEDVGKSPWHLSFSFAFFLHGESTVCASVDVRQHPPVRTLTSKRLARLQQTPPAAPDAQRNVILAPFGLEGTVSGRAWPESEPCTQRLLDAWRQLYPLEQACTALEVICGGVRMRYPQPYVLLTEPCGPAPPPGPPPRPPPGPRPARALAAAALHALSTRAPHLSTEPCVAEGCEKSEDFVDPTRKTPCTCAKSRRRVPRAPRPRPFHAREHQPAYRNAPGPLACSPGSPGGASPAHAVSAPPSAGAPPPSPHLVIPPLQPGLVPASLHTPAPTPDPATPTPLAHDHPPPKHTYQSDSPPSGALNTSCPEPPPSLHARPVLPAAPRRAEPAHDEHALHMLYDYTTVHAWLEHPVKRFKSSESKFREELALGCSPGGDLYAGHDHTRMAAGPAPAPDRGHERHDHNEDVKDYKNLFTSDGLCPTLKDLDQIFDNSDDAASGDESLQVGTPPDWSKCVENRMVRAEELSKMFPTPPSMEAHAQASPGFTLPDDTPATRTQTSHHHHSPPPDPIEDWSYVFKPPTVCKYVGSSKYAPVPLGSSPALPPHAVYRPRWQRESDPAPRRQGVKRSSSPLSSTRSSRSRRAPAPRAAPPSPRAPSPPARPAPRPACPLLLNVLLADTVLNVFRDHNFDSCTLCVCNADPKTVGNIRGADAAVYLPGARGGDEPARCSCGFSSVVNRRRAHRAGLFYEDEVEITGLDASPPAGDAGGGGGAGVAWCAAWAACVAPAPADALSAHAARAAGDPGEQQHEINLLEYMDGCAAACGALSAAGGASGAGGAGGVHRWPFLGAAAPRSSRHVLRLLRRLRPLLQDAIQKRCCGARMWDGVSGPLTWRQFHRLAGRGNEDLCEPQPVPVLVVGHEREWVTVSPYALRHWPALALEPYAAPQDLAYVALHPRRPAHHLRAFFREVSTAYESCRLGRHQPLAGIARDGLLAAPPAAPAPPAPDEWAGALPPGAPGDCVRAYSEALRNTLVPQLAQITVDHSLFDTDQTPPVKIKEERPTPSPMRPPSTPRTPSPCPETSESSERTTPLWSSATLNTGGEEENGGAGLVVYLVEPPAPPSQRPALLRALLRLAARLQQRVKPREPLVKIISMEGIWDTWSGGGAARALAFSVFSGARRTLRHHAGGKSLTGFGTAAAAARTLRQRDEKCMNTYRLSSPAWVLAPMRALGGEGGEWWGGGGSSGGGVLYVAYCLSRDQRWLLAAACDQRGELVDTVAINVHVPTRSRTRRCGPARRLGLGKLMDWTLGVMSQCAQPWRLVVGRLGRIGHGELKGWSWLLSRPNLLRASSTLRDTCGACAALGGSGGAGGACVVSACLVSTEPEPCLRLMPDRFTPDERFSQAAIHSPLHTPRDNTATHILVFPISATTQSNQQPMANGEDNDMMFLGVDMDMGDEDMGEDNINDLLIGDMLNHMWPQGSPRASPRRDAASREGSPARGLHRASSFTSGDENVQENVGSVLQQPLALGYLVSTAPLRGLPAWWWGGAAHLQGACPAFLRTALHLHASSLNNDDLVSLTQRRDHHAHPLDSTLTTDVLRYVLEGYNALSWLTLDAETHDRASCLPLQLQSLLQLYHAASALA